MTMWEDLSEPTPPSPLPAMSASALEPQGGRKLSRSLLPPVPAVNCICQNGPQRPGMQEVLNTLERHTVCTGTQCFESEEDAFGITTTPNGSPTNNTTFFMFMMCALHTHPRP